MPGQRRRAALGVGSRPTAPREPQVAEVRRPRKHTRGEVVRRAPDHLHVRHAPLEPQPALEPHGGGTRGGRILPDLLQPGTTTEHRLSLTRRSCQREHGLAQDYVFSNSEVERTFLTSNFFITFYNFF